MIEVWDCAGLYVCVKQAAGSFPSACFTPLMRLLKWPRCSVPRVRTVTCGRKRTAMCRGGQTRRAVYPQFSFNSSALESHREPTYSLTPGLLALILCWTLSPLEPASSYCQFAHCSACQLLLWAPSSLPLALPKQVAQRHRAWVHLLTSAAVCAEFASSPRDGSCCLSALPQPRRPAGRRGRVVGDGTACEPS